jgi:hypothetical protein
MGKIIRLTESDLTRLVRRVIIEQSKVVGYTTPDEYGKAIFNTLGPNFTISASESNAMGDDMPGTYNSYFLQRFNRGDKWGKDGVSLNFDVKYYPKNSEKQSTGTLSIVIIFSKGIPKSLGPCMLVLSSKATTLNKQDIMRKIFPKIKGITYNTTLS